MMEMLPPHVIQFRSLAASAFIFAIATVLIVPAAAIIYDVTQHKDAVLRNYPVCILSAGIGITPKGEIRPLERDRFRFLQSEA
jgi:hypothetical protein